MSQDCKGPINLATCPKCGFAKGPDHQCDDSPFNVLQHITVEGPPPERAVTVYYSTPDLIAQLVAQLMPLPRHQWDAYAPRTEWMTSLAQLCGGMPDGAGEYTAFIGRDNDTLTVVVATTPPMVVVELPFRVSTEPPEVRRPILGPDGGRLA